MHSRPDPRTTRPAPTEFVVGPPTAERNAHGLKHPGKDRPRPGPLGPGLIQATLEHGGDCEGKGHREPHIAHVEHRRMNREREVLQHRIKIGAILSGRHQAQERIGGPERKEHEAGADDAHDPEHAARETCGQLPAEGGNRNAPDRQDQHPQQQRSFVRAPQRRHLVEHRQLRIGIARHVQHREVIVGERIHQAGEGGGDEHELPGHRRTRHAHPLILAFPGADQPEETPATG